MQEYRYDTVKQPFRQRFKNHHRAKQNAVNCTQGYRSPVFSDYFEFSYRIAQRQLIAPKPRVVKTINLFKPGCR